MDKGIIDYAIYEQINRYGRKHVIAKYEILLNELTEAMNEMGDMKKASIISDAADMISLVIKGLKN